MVRRIGTATTTTSSRLPKIPQGPDLGLTRVLRGGSFWHRPYECRSASRSQLQPDASQGSLFYIGFRVAMSQDAPAKSGSGRSNKPSLTRNAKGAVDPTTKAQTTLPDTTSDTGAKATGGASPITNSIGMKLTLVPSGEFIMGSREPAEMAADDSGGAVDLFRSSMRCIGCGSRNHSTWAPTMSHGDSFVSSSTTPATKPMTKRKPRSWT